MNISPPRTTSGTVRVLSIDGGGYLGLATAAFLEETERNFAASAASRFDLFCGTSTGAILALALASGMTAAEASTLYETLGAEIFPRPKRLRRWFPRIHKLLFCQHDNAALHSALQDAFGDKTLGDLRKSGKRVLVTALCLTTGKPRIFKTDHSPTLNSHDDILLRDVALASSAAPVYLPVVELHHPTRKTRELFCDGGLVANSPALLGYAEAVSELAAKPQDVSVLSLSTPREDLSEPLSANGGRPPRLKRSYWDWGAGERIISLAMDGGSHIADTALQRITRASGSHYCRVHLTQPRGVGLDVVTEYATATLRQLGIGVGQEGSMRAKMSHFFGTTGGRDG